MKKRILERRLRQLGAVFVRHGGNHDMWRLADGSLEPVARHREVPEQTARIILAKAADAQENAT